MGSSSFHIWCWKNWDTRPQILWSFEINTRKLFYRVIFMCKLSTNLRWWKNVRKINTRKLFYPVIFMSKLSVQISDGEKNVRKINRRKLFHVQIIYKSPMVKKFTKINTWTLFYPVIFMCKLSTNLRWWKNVRKINTI